MAPGPGYGRRGPSVFASPDAAASRHHRRGSVTESPTRQRGGITDAAASPSRAHPGGEVSVQVRNVQPVDVPAVVAMVHELAAFERAAQQCRLTEDQLSAALFAPAPALFGQVALLPGTPGPVGFTLWFLNFSTWRGRHGIFLEDVYVRPSARHAGVATALLGALAAECAERGYERLDWWVLDWNPARSFFGGLGAAALPEWVPYRLAGPALTALAARSAPARAGDVAADPVQS